MAIVRLNFITVDPNDASQAERIWKQHCAPVLTRQQGCLSEQLLKCADAPGEYVSYSEWYSQDDIDRFRESEDHDTIQRYSGDLADALSQVKYYEIII